MLIRTNLVEERKYPKNNEKVMGEEGEADSFDRPSTVAASKFKPSTPKTPQMYRFGSEGVSWHGIKKTLPDGTEYVGHNELQSGDGIRFLKDGRIEKGEFKNGTLVKGYRGDFKTLTKTQPQTTGNNAEFITIIENGEGSFVSTDSEGNPTHSSGVWIDGKPAQRHPGGAYYQGLRYEHNLFQGYGTVMMPSPNGFTKFVGNFKDSDFIDGSITYSTQDNMVCVTNLKNRQVVNRELFNGNWAFLSADGIPLRGVFKEGMLSVEIAEREILNMCQKPDFTNLPNLSKTFAGYSLDWKLKLLENVAHRIPEEAFEFWNKYAPSIMSGLMEPLIRGMNIISNENDLEKYCPLKSDRIIRLIYSNNSQYSYAVWMCLMSEAARGFFKSKEQVDYDAFLKRIGDLRSIQAKLVDRGPNARNFGVIRRVDLCTPLEEGKNYEPWLKYLREIGFEGFITAKSPVGDTVKATSITLPKEGEQERLLRLENRGSRWQHARPNAIPKIRAFFEQWTNHILTTDYTQKQDDLISDLAHWYHTAVQGTFYERGSSAITQAIFVALCQEKNIEPPKFMKLIDCWALSMEVEDFRDQIFKPWFKGESIPLVKKYQGFDNPNLPTLPPGFYNHLF